MIKKLWKKFKKCSIRRRVFIILIFALVLISFIGLTFGRYIYDNYKSLYLASKNFYFNSDKLSLSGSRYQLNNWSGVDPYNIVVNMNSKKNNIEVATSDIEYNISYTCSNTVNCEVNKNNGVIYSSTNTDSFILSMTPTSNFNDGDEVTITITASSTSPYEQTITGTFILKVGKLGLSYEIDDSVGSPYMELRITNTLEYYEVRTAFTTTNNVSYAVGDRIDVRTYLALTSAEKNNLASVIVSLSFNPAVIIIDNTSKEYLANISNTSSTVNGYQYIDGFDFKIDAIDSVVIKFYKVNKMVNYTYPIINNTPVVTLAFS